MICPACGHKLATPKNEFGRAVEAFESTLPPEIRLYDVNGQTLFPTLGSDGSLTMIAVSYLIQRGREPGPEHFELPLDLQVVDYGGGWKAIKIEFPCYPRLSEQGITERLQKAHAQLTGA